MIEMTVMFISKILNKCVSVCALKCGKDDDEDDDDVVVVVVVMM